MIVTSKSNHSKIMESSSAKLSSLINTKSAEYKLVDCKKKKRRCSKLSSPLFSSSSVIGTTGTTKMIILSSLLVALNFVNYVSCDIFSSTSHLQNLMYLERHMIYQMHDWIDAQESKIQQLKGSVMQQTDFPSSKLLSVTGQPLTLHFLSLLLSPPLYLSMKELMT